MELNGNQLESELREKYLSWMCRHHPTEWFHEVGCPHMTWSKEELQSALESAKISSKSQMETLTKQLEKSYDKKNNDNNLGEVL